MQNTMKSKSKAVTILLLLTVLSGSCQEESMIQNCEGENGQRIETFYNEELREIPCSIQNINPDTREVNLVIKTQADYDKYFTCSAELPTVDFEKYFILAGRYRHHQCAEFNRQQVFICNNKLIYKVEMHELICAAFTNVFYVTVIERKYEGLQVVFDVGFKN
ncbi:hypothetical protein [Rhodonellum sp.]|uniref:hypothetical protein n=1 Tax=Rhodonellum sp. TaxID=2231180 RepID=UPI00271951E1|nr:hypothetical protein [Rhodonellum sp.]MDO9553746.1 hypothetical protein [Rhodonellum sp.]